MLFSPFKPEVDRSGKSDGSLSISDSVGETDVSFDLSHVPSVFVSSSSNPSVTLLSGLLTGISSAIVVYGSVGMLALSDVS